MRLQDLHHTRGFQPGGNEVSTNHVIMAFSSYTYSYTYTHIGLRMHAYVRRFNVFNTMKRTHTDVNVCAQDIFTFRHSPLSLFLSMTHACMCPRVSVRL
jgi:hypothetical protein